METVAGVVAIVGIVAHTLAWRLVARGRDVWRTMPPLFAVLGVVSAVLLPSIAAREPAADDGFGASAQIVIGVVTGAGLFVATRIFVAVVGRFAAFARDTRDAYRQAGTVPTAAAFGLSIVVVALGEEVFWRGLVYGVGVQRGLSIGGAGIVGWVLYVLANRPSRLQPIIAASIVGGALWIGLAWWTGGILASIASHMLWTGLMLGFPPGSSRAEVV
ncbi:MAG: CPBP family intramembrane metalloprotease [Chloroflexota bacterium]|nr:CPBP family intramembrane metalloprotease [Chloroflexota bacterium]